MSPADQVLFDQWITRRDANAFTRLAEKYATMVYAVGRRITGNTHDAEDVAQAAFEALASQRRAPRVHLGAWLHRVATYRALNHLKAERRRADREARYDRERPNQSEIGWDDIYDLVDEAIAALPGKQRDVVVAGIRSALGKRGIAVPVALLGVLLVHGAEAATPVALAAQLGKIALSGFGGNTGVGIGLWQGMVAGLGSAKGLAACAFILCIPAIWLMNPVDHSELLAGDKLTGSQSAVAEKSADATGMSAWVARAEQVLYGAPAVNTQDAASSVISGVVVDRNDKPQAHAVINALIEMPGHKNAYDLKRAKALADGSFVLKDVPEGEVTLTVQPARWQMAEASNGGAPVKIQHRDGDDQDGLRLVVLADKTIAGRVATTAGTPVPGIKILFRHKDLEGVLGQTTTDMEGRYRFEQLPDGPYVIRVDSPEHATEERKGVQAGSQGVNFTLEKLGLLKGRVVDADTGEGIPTFYCAAARPFGEPGQRAFETTNAELGCFTMSVDPRSGSITVGADGYSPSQFQLPEFSSGETVEGVVIPLTRIYKAHGIVFDATGNPAASACVVADDPSRAIWTSKEGKFEIDVNSLNAPKLNVVHESLGCATVDIDRTNFDPIMITLQPGGTIDGTVTVAGKALAGANISLLSVDRAARRPVRTDETGRYRIHNVAPGLVEIKVDSGASGTDDRDKRVEVQVDAQGITRADIAFPPATSALEGEIYYPSGVLDERSVSVQAIYTGSGEREFIDARVEEGNHYSFDALPAGPVKLNVSVSSLRKSFDLVVPRNSRLKQDINLDLGTSLVCAFGNLPDRFRGVFVGVIRGEEGTAPESAKEFETVTATACATAACLDGQPVTIPGLEAGAYTVIAYVVPENPARISSPSERELLRASFFSAVQTVTIKGEAEAAVTLSF